MKKKFIISVDVEGIPLRDSGMDYSSIINGVPLLLDLFSEFNVCSTFFVTSDAAENTAHVLREVIKREHEIGCHAYGSQGYADLKGATDTINEHFKVSPIGFRAHRHKINGKTLMWLSTLGYKYDSSIVSSSQLFNKHYYPKAPKTPYRPSLNNICEEGYCSLIEIPISALPIIRLPIGLGYIKLFGLNLYKLFLSRLNQEIVTMYLHPYDLFPLSGDVDAPLNFMLAQKRRTKGFEVLQGLLEHLEEKFSPAYIRAQEILNYDELVSRGELNRPSPPCNGGVLTLNDWPFIKIWGDLCIF